MDGNESEIRIGIEGMHCGSCAQLIEETLGDEPGVKQASVNLEEKRAHVAFDAARTDGPRIVAVISELGYTATVLDRVS